MGLFDLRLGDDVNVLVANGLGGGSLINAGVMLEPDDATLPPSPLFRQVVAEMKQDRTYEDARRMLGAQRRGVDNTIDRHPKGPPMKFAALGSIGDARVVPLTVAMEDGANASGVELKACTFCGNCMTGCNVGAKDSLDANLLVDAQRRGADCLDIVTGASVLALSRPSRYSQHHGLWCLHVAHTMPALQERERDPLELFARHVILAGGALGSPEILLRSRTDKLVFSTRLGESFSGNGDNISAIVGLDLETRGAAEEEGGSTDVGPTITGSFDLRPATGRPVRIQEFSVPSALRRIYDETVTTSRVLHELAIEDRYEHGSEIDDGKEDPMAVRPHAMARTLLVGTIGHDDAGGALRLPHPRRRPDSDPAPTQGILQIVWTAARTGAELLAAHEALRAQVEGTPPRSGGPRLIANPIWQMLPGPLKKLVSQPYGPVLTVHPLGGCPMGATIDDGVVDEWGRVYDGRSGDANDDATDDVKKDKKDKWFGTLAVLDGSIIPGSLGANPALTIAATAMRAIVKLKTEWEYTDATKATDAPPPPSTPRRHWPRSPYDPPRLPITPTEIEVIERLAGPIELELGGAEPEAFVAELTIAYEPITLKQLLVPGFDHRLSFPQGANGRLASKPSTLRLFARATWDEQRLRVQSDNVRRRHAVFEARVSGSLRFMHREFSSACQRQWRSAFAWLVNRGARDIWQARRSPEGFGGSLREHARSLWHSASRAGEVRRFDYEVAIGPEPWSNGTPLGRKLVALLADGCLRGHKRITYNRRANPWRQLTRLELSAMPGFVRGSRPVLELDTRFLANQGVPLLRLVQQQDQPTALADLASFALWFLRVILGTHLWTFRMPDAREGRDEIDRLPGSIRGLPAPEVTNLAVDRMPGRDDLLEIRLTRYRREGTDLPPLVMIHGYSVSGNTFTHPSIPVSAAEYFHRNGRDVWIVDLRTSTGLATATEPWAMEEAALIDIPAALLHIRHVTGQRVDVLAHCIGCVMLSMAVLTDARDVRSSNIQLGVDTWLTAEDFGTLTAFNGPNPHGGEHPCIRRVVLSQKGPVLRYTDDNIFRAWLLGSIRRMLLTDGYQFTPPRNPGLADQLLDRALSSLPYPDADYDRENPLWPCATTPWVATRHRMDALYGRDFGAANLADGTLRAIDDLFGAINLDTVAQTIHFTRFNTITNQRGRGEFVTRKRLRQRWGGIPTLAIHGRNNGLVDVTTQDLLALHLGNAGVPIAVRDADKPPYRDLEHQDVLIGRGAWHVFEDIDRFLREEPPPRTPVVVDPPFVFGRPWIGPRIELIEADDDAGLNVVAMSRPDQGAARLLLLPAVETATEILLAPVPLSEPLISVCHAYGQWLRVRVDPPFFADTVRGVPGYLALVVYEIDETKADFEEQFQRDIADHASVDAAQDNPDDQRIITLPSPEWSTERVELEARALAIDEPVGVANEAAPATAVGRGNGVDRDGNLRRTILAALRRWVTGSRARAARLGFVRSSDLRRALDAHRAEVPAPLSLALASCQYPPGLLDREVASRSLERIGEDARAQRIDLALFVGDQVYVDATAGLFDPTRRDERFDQPHEKALRLPAMRAVMQHLPVRTMLDDHELSDNWQRLAPKVEQAWPERAEAKVEALRRGRAAWAHHQEMRAKPRDEQPDDAEKRRARHAQIRFAGRPFFLADTRTRREPRGSTTDAGAQILEGARWDQLEAWLAQQAHALKFVVSPSLWLPRQAKLAADAAHAASSDAWDGYPASLERVLATLLKTDARNTVFLSGDEHHSFHAHVTAWHRSDPDRRICALSVHGSALYAPLPFANGRPSQFLERDAFSVPSAFALGAIEVCVRTVFAPPGDGYVRLGCDSDKPVCSQLRVHYVKADSSVMSHDVMI